MSKFLIFITFIMVISCRGYHVKSNQNPFLKYGVKSISVPMFVNHSIFPNVEGPFSEEIVLTLFKFSGLKVYTGENKKADAILIGIITSGDHRKSVYKTIDSKYTDSDLKNSVEGRNHFYIPTQTGFSLTVRYVLIKNPTFSEIKIMKEDFTKNIIPESNSKIIFNEEIPLSTSFSRVVSSSDSGKQVNFTRNKALVERAITDLAKHSARVFEDVLLYAF